LKTFLIQLDKRYFFPLLLAFAFALPFNTLTAINGILVASLFFLWIFKIFDSRGKILFRTPLDIPLLVFFVWAGLSFFWTADFHESFNSWIALGKQIFLFYLVATTVETKDQFVKILAVFVAAILITDLYSIIDFFNRGGNILDRHIRAGPLGSMGDYNSLTMLIISFLPLGLIFGVFTTSRPLKIFLYFFSFLSLFVLYLGYTRSGWLTVALQTLIFYFFYSRRIFYYLFGFLLSLTLVTTFLIHQYDLTYGTFEKRLEHTEDTVNPFTMETRIQVWKFGLNDILRHPILGNGFGREIFQKVNKDNKIIEFTPHLHNSFLEVAFELGLPGLFLFISCFALLIFHGFKTTRNSIDPLLSTYAFYMVVMSSGVVFKNLFDHMLIGNLAEIFWFMSGLLFSRRDFNQ
jgi:putative inorganic carbon (HCO3(-)) transporter